jgi:hypothetical protein
MPKAIAPWNLNPQLRIRPGSGRWSLSGLSGQVARARALRCCEATSVFA